jgi:hypothetical protein
LEADLCGVGPLSGVSPSCRGQSSAGSDLCGVGSPRGVRPPRRDQSSLRGQSSAWGPTPLGSDLRVRVGPPRGVSPPAGSDPRVGARPPHGDRPPSGVGPSCRGQTSASGSDLRIGGRPLRGRTSMSGSDLYGGQPSALRSALRGVSPPHWRQTSAGSVLPMGSVLRVGSVLHVEVSPLRGQPSMSGSDLPAWVSPPWGRTSA